MSQGPTSSFDRQRPSRLQILSLYPAELPALASYFRLQRQHHDDSHPAERWQFGDHEREPAEGRLLAAF